MTYQEALAYILSFTDLERLRLGVRRDGALGLERMRRLLALLGDPQGAVPAVHIAGTKGKGSTASIIASVLRAARYRSGLFTSPHLHTFRERIDLEAQPIGEGELAALVQTLRPWVERLEREGPASRPTTFEVITALAFLHFARGGAQLQVLETGLGGRLDSTNVVTPEVAVLTSISLDHTQVLGDTLPQIAAEKAGIIKPGRWVVLAPQPPEVEAVVVRACEERGAPLIRVGQEVRWQKGEADLEGQRFRVQGLHDSYDLFLPLLGDHQLENAATAVAALECLERQGFSLPAAALAVGMREVRWPGRFQILARGPWLVADGAHNVASVERLAQTLGQYFPGRRTVLVMGTSEDKDIPGMAQVLAPRVRAVVVTRSLHPRAAEVDTLWGAFRACGHEPLVTKTVPQALAQAQAQAALEDVICVTGSLFVVAEAIQHCCGIPGEEALLARLMVPASVERGR